MKFNDAFESDWYMDVTVLPSGTTKFQISLKEGHRRWRREEITLSARDVERLAQALQATRWPAKEDGDEQDEQA